MELRVLQYYLAVAKEESISRAAESLHISHPTLSRQIRDMEEQLGTQLFIRGNRKITLTEEGILLRQRAEEILGVVQKTEEEIQEIINQSVKKPVGSKRVVCLNTEEVFDSIKSAKTKYPEAKSISDCCRHIAKSSGTLPTTKEKMKDCLFTLVDGKRSLDDEENKYPKVIKEAYQVFECTWMSELDNASNDKVMDEYVEPYHDFNGITSKNGAHFILKIDNILMKPKQYNAILNGVKRTDFPSIPVDYGYRDNEYFWYIKPKCAKKSTYT